MRFTRRIRERGVVSVPRSVLEALDVHVGDLVEIDLVRVVRVDQPTHAATPGDDVSAPPGADAPEVPQVAGDEPW